MAEPTVSKPAQATPWWLWPNILSLDAPVVSVVWLTAFAAAYQTPVMAPAYIALFLGVWCLYSLDRLLDVLKLRAGDPSPGLRTPRHEFARRHARLLAVLIFFAVMIGGLIAVTQLDRPIFGAGMIVAVAAIAYFGAFVSPLGGKKPLPGKELAGGVLIAAGITVPVFADYSGSLPVVPAFAIFAALCALNCLMIASRDGDLPGGKGFARLLTILGIAIALSAVGLAAFGTTIESAPMLRPLYFVEALAGAGLVCLQLARGTAGREAFRVLADVALLTPLIPVAGWY